MLRFCCASAACLATPCATTASAAAMRRSSLWLASMYTREHTLAAVDTRGCRTSVNWKQSASQAGPFENGGGKCAIAQGITPTPLKYSNALNPSVSPRNPVELSSAPTTRRMAVVPRPFWKCLSSGQSLSLCLATIVAAARTGRVTQARPRVPYRASIAWPLLAGNTQQIQCRSLPAGASCYPHVRPTVCFPTIRRR